MGLTGTVKFDGGGDDDDDGIETGIVIVMEEVNDVMYVYVYMYARQMSIVDSVQQKV